MLVEEVFMLAEKTLDEQKQLFKSKSFVFWYDKNRRFKNNIATLGLIYLAYNAAIMAACESSSKCRGGLKPHKLDKKKKSHMLTCTA